MKNESREQDPLTHSVSQGTCPRDSCINTREVIMRIRKSKPEDLSRIMEIYACARQFMAEHGNPRQWAARNWPPEKLIRQDIRSGKSFVCVVDKEDFSPESCRRDMPGTEGQEGGGQETQEHIAAVFFFDQGKDCEPTYLHIEDGAWIDDTPYGVVHRIASDGSTRGAGSFCINWAFSQCGHLRMDTHGDNTVMQNLLTKLGFQRCGIIYVVEDTDPRIAYEKLLSEDTAG